MCLEAAFQKDVGQNSVHLQRFKASNVGHLSSWQENIPTESGDVKLEQIEWNNVF